MTVGDIIKEYREAHSISQRQFALKCGISNGYISMLEKGKNPKTNEPIMPSLSALKAIASAMEMPLNDLFSQADDIPVDISQEIAALQRENSIPMHPSLLPIQTKRIPLLGSIACGEPIYANEEHGAFVLTSDTIDADFCLRAQGDSMNGARILDGDIVFIRKQEEVENGQIAAVLIGDEATLKRVYYYPEKSKLVLNPENPAYEPLVYVGAELEEVRILGRAVAFQSVIR